MSHRKLNDYHKHAVHHRRMTSRTSRRKRKRTIKLKNKRLKRNQKGGIFPYLASLM